MARQDRDLRTDDIVTETPIYTTDRDRDRAVRDYRETRRGATSETRSMLQDLAWFIPLLLLGLLGYYLYQSYYAAPTVPRPARTDVTAPAATTPTPAADATMTAGPAATTTSAGTPVGVTDTTAPAA